MDGSDSSNLTAEEEMMFFNPPEPKPVWHLPAWLQIVSPLGRALVVLGDAILLGSVVVFSILFMCVPLIIIAISIWQLIMSY